MRIISDFHDYYDVGMKNGYDPKLPYNRFRCEENVEDLIFCNRYQRWYWERYPVYFIGFAGKTYPSVKYPEDSIEANYGFDIGNLTDNFYLQVLDTFGGFYMGRTPRREKDRNRILSDMRKDFNKIIELKDSKTLLSLFERFKTAIFVYQLGAKNIIINERLNQYGFQKVLPPELAFQELEVYVGAYLTQPVIEEPPIPDKIKAEIHGFNQFSFRKDKKK